MSTKSKNIFYATLGLTCDYTIIVTWYSIVASVLEDDVVVYWTLTVSFPAVESPSLVFAVSVTPALPLLSS